MKEEPNQLSQRIAARMAGLFYLAYIVIFAICSSIQGKPVTWTDPGATANAIAASPGMFRLGVVMDLIAALLFLLAAWSLFALFRRVNKDLALLFLLLNLVGVAIEGVGTMLHFSALMLDTGAPWLAAFTPDQLHTLGLILLQVAGMQSKACTLFYGVWLFPLGWLVIQSRMLPKFFGIMLILDGTSLMICFVQMWFFPGYEKWMYPLYPVMFVAECGLGLWLAIKGVKESVPTPVLAG